MLKELQKVRDVLEEVAHVYVEITKLGDALKEEGVDGDGDGWLTLVSNRATEIILDINNMLYIDVGYTKYFTVHSKIMTLCAHMVGPTTQTVKCWLHELIEADNAVIRALIFR